MNSQYSFHFIWSPIFIFCLLRQTRGSLSVSNLAQISEPAQPVQVWVSRVGHKFIDRWIWTQTKLTHLKKYIVNFDSQGSRNLLITRLSKYLRLVCAHQTLSQYKEKKSCHFNSLLYNKTDKQTENYHERGNLIMTHRFAPTWPNPS